MARATRVIGSTIRVDGAPATIIGVADPRVTFPAANVDYFTLLDLDRRHRAVPPWTRAGRPRARRPVDATPRQDASRVIQEVSREYPGPHATAASDFSGFPPIIRPIRDDIAGGVKPTLALLTAAVIFVLCLTCVNVATLELVRSSARRTELAVRSALGAQRSRLIAGALIEGGLQAIAGGALGVVLSGVAVTLF